MRINESCIYFANNNKYFRRIEDAENECSNKINFSRLFFLKSENELHFYRGLIEKIQKQIAKDREQPDRYYLIGLKYDGLLFLYLFKS